MVLYEAPPGQKARQEIACGLKDVLSADSCLELAEWCVREGAPWALTMSFLDFVFARFSLIAEDVELAIEGVAQWKSKVKAMDGMLMMADNLGRLDPQDLVGLGDPNGLNRASGSWRLSQAVIRQIQGILVKRISTPGDGDRRRSEVEATELRELLNVADRSARDLFIRRRTFEPGKLVEEQADWKERVAEIQGWSEKVPAGQAGAKTLKVSVAPFRHERGVIVAFLEELDRPKKELRPETPARRSRAVDPSQNSDTGFYHEVVGSVPSPPEASASTQSGSPSTKPRRRDVETPFRPPTSRLSEADGTPEASTSGSRRTAEIPTAKTEESDPYVLTDQIPPTTAGPPVSARCRSEASPPHQAARISSSLSSLDSVATPRRVQQASTVPEPLPPRSPRTQNGPAATGLADVQGRPMVAKPVRKRMARPKKARPCDLPAVVKMEAAEPADLTVNATKDAGTGVSQTTINLSDDEEDLPEGFVNGEEEEFIVESIIARKSRGRQPGFQCLVRWQGYTPEYDTWEPEHAVKSTTAWHRFMRERAAANSSGPPTPAPGQVPSKRAKSVPSSSQQPGSSPKRKRAMHA